ncbi:MAG: hypothetical protein ACSLFM_07475 [Tepidiformaceae bacterium]
MSFHTGALSWALATVLGIAFLVLASCGGDDDAPSTTAVADIPTNPDVLGTLIVADYRAMLEELFTFINGLPPAAGIAGDVAALKARYIERFVEYGTSART